MRTFVPSRIKEIKQTGKTFKRSQKFSLDRRLRGSFGVHSGEGKYDVTIRFNARAADYIREKRWHDSQVLVDRPGGGLDLHLKLTSLKEVERWVLSWGGEAAVVSPRELAASVRVAAQRLLESTTQKSGLP
jgi:predicted DNA-binding transcriptional regulator YafY